MGGSYIGVRDWSFYVATLGGLGWVLRERMPGTVGSFLALLIRWFLKVDLLSIFFLFLLGLWASERYSKALKEEDPSSIVIDEFVGYFIAMWNLNDIMLIPSFFLFRLLDVIKPFPIRFFEKFPGGWGIMLDDVVAGLLTNMLIFLGLWLGG
ncbi:MAG: phosphatidylglycerophosphatase A [Synergistetes bacterium]|nr:phosphatidylglycerophosphatase A [Synergistota bacterium]MCX8127863.1 phosphatidylglycerophosphatase A [Synergistota bacterium]MDW8192125.1 phosphatidylglycerophosphatase A [Synergistota bacterium]